MSASRLLPEKGLPTTGYPAGETLEWMHGDNLSGYRERGGHPMYGEHDVQYRFNGLGYRCPEFDVAANIRIVAIGCSYVLGTGLAQADIFHERFAARLRSEYSKSVVLWNLGRAGASNDYISRVLHLAVPSLNPHIVLINFTHLVRREYLSVQNNYWNYNPSFTPADDVTKEIFRHFEALSSPHDDQRNFFMNYKAVELLLKGRCWLFSHIKGMDSEMVGAHMDFSRFVGLLRTVDKARDGGHPGIESHRVLADLYWDKFIELAEFERVPSFCGVG